MKKIVILLLLIAIIILLIIFIPSKKYSDKDFNITTYKSDIDKDNDGLDDQSDILNNAKIYIKTRPRYKSKYYSTGYPDDQYGVCTDLVAFSLKNAGYDLMELVDRDIKLNISNYKINKADKNIDFRRVKNLDLYFKNNSINLTIDLSKIDEWQAGDIVVFPHHIGIISDNRNHKGIPYLIHHARPLQFSYEEDVLENMKIIGHYRVS